MSKEVYVVKWMVDDRVNDRLLYDEIYHIFSSLSEASYACMDLAIYYWNHCRHNRKEWTYVPASWKNIQWETEEDPKYGYIYFKSGYLGQVFYIECVEMD